VLNHVRQGSGEPLILVHGIGSQWQIWGPVLERLARERDVVALDLPGFGASAPLAGEVTLAALADAVWELVRSLGIDRRPHVAGNSLGGAVALELARSGRARSATGLSPLGFARGREIAFARRSLAGSRALARALAPATGPLLATGAGRTLLQSQFFARPWRVPAADAAMATRNLASSPGFGATLPLLATVAPADLGVPVTIAWGARDLLLIPRQGRRACAVMPRAGHLWLAGCGHVPTWDDPQEVARVLLAGSRG
jgi:pimeloyl-ACP methyl ester carboxylesterase